MPKSDLSGIEAAYLKEAYRLRESGRLPSVSVLATEFGVTMPSVIDVLRKLERRGLVRRTPWKAPTLTQRGLAEARRIIHSHRVLEVYYGEALGLDEAYACAEASKIDYLIGTKAVERMCDTLHHPAHCLHGLTIEHVKDGRLQKPAVVGNGA